MTNSFLMHKYLYSVYQRVIHCLLSNEIILILTLWAYIRLGPNLFLSYTASSQCSLSLCSFY